MKTKVLRSCFALWCMLIMPRLATAEDVTSKGIATVTLEVPYSVWLWNERPQFTIRLRNDSKAPLACIPDASEASGKQLFIRVERAETNYEAQVNARVEAERKSRKARLAPQDKENEAFFVEIERERLLTVQAQGRWDVVATVTNKVWVKPGETIIWHGGRVDSWLFHMNGGVPRGIQAQILVGPGQWVSSQVVPVRLIEGDAFSMARVFEFEGRHVHRWVQKGVIEGKEYLFSMGGYRICEIPTGATPRFEYDDKMSLLKINFDGVNVPPILFHIFKREIINP